MTAYGSASRSISGEEHERASVSSSIPIPDQHGQSSLAKRINSLGSLGGHNSFSSFSNSYQRAQGFIRIENSKNQNGLLPAVDDHESSLRDVMSQRHISNGFGSGFPKLGHERNHANGNQNESAPLLVKRIQHEGRAIHVVVGQSTLPQTILNSINTLVGVGLLSLPLAFLYAGWLVGGILLLCIALTTRYTAHILARCLDTNPSLVTFGDLAFAAYGQNARLVISALFSVELTAALVAFVVVFADSLNALFPTQSTLTFKLIAFFVLTPLSFAPLHYLSFTSILGIIATLTMIGIVFADGFIKSSAPGSLRSPMPVFLAPEKWLSIPLSLGLLLAPFGGHAVFPNIYRDMRHPNKYGRGLIVVFTFSFLLFFSTGVVGVLMFGKITAKEITSNIVRLESAYPPALTYIMVLCLAIIAITKSPLTSRPIISTVEVITGLDERFLPEAGGEHLTGLSLATRGILRFGLRIVVNIVIVSLAIAIPDFDRIMGFLGSALGFNVCITLPIAFYVRICRQRISWISYFFHLALMALSIVLSIFGTVVIFLPRRLVVGDGRLGELGEGRISVQ